MKKLKRKSARFPALQKGQKPSFQYDQIGQKKLHNFYIYLKNHYLIYNRLRSYYFKKTEKQFTAPLPGSDNPLWPATADHRCAANDRGRLRSRAARTARRGRGRRH